jgi:hypothetical protein
VAGAGDMNPFSRPAPQVGDDVIVNYGDIKNGKMVARGFMGLADAWGFQISLHEDGLVSVACCSRRFPDVVSSGQMFGLIGRPLDGLAAAHANHGGVRDIVHGGCFDLAQVTQDLMAVWAMFQAEKEGKHDPV